VFLFFAPFAPLLLVVVLAYLAYLVLWYTLNALEAVSASAWRVAKPAVTRVPVLVARSMALLVTSFVRVLALVVR
jgi:hypothetical protein